MPTTYETLYERIVKCSKILAKVRGEETNIFPHASRHSRIECLLNGEDPRIKDENGDNKKFTLDEVRMFAHHEDISTTNSYAKDHTDEKIDDMFGLGK
jgi:tRNA splicing endonuclease